MQATWPALQPMHFDTSISLATSAVWRWWGEAVVVAERRVTSSDCSAMARLLCLLNVDQERLELRCLRVRVAHHRRQGVGQESRLGDPLEAPVDGHSDVMDRFAIGLQRLDAFGHHR